MSSAPVLATWLKTKAWSMHFGQIRGSRSARGLWAGASPSAMTTCANLLCLWEDKGAFRHCCPLLTCRVAAFSAPSSNKQAGIYRESSAAKTIIKAMII